MINLLSIFNYPQEQFFKFTSLILGFISILIFIKANKLYLKTNDKKPLLLGISFLGYAIFQFINFNDLTEHSIAINMFLGNIFYSVGIVLPIYYINNPIAKDPKLFKKKSYMFFTFLFLSLLPIHYFLNKYLITKSSNFYSFEVIYIYLYILITFIYINIMIENKLKPLNYFTIGLLLSAISEVFVPFHNFFLVGYQPLIVIFSEIFIYLGLKDICFKSKFFSIKQKFLLFPGLFFVGIYLLLNCVGLFAFRYVVPLEINYFLLLFFIVFSIFKYLLINKIVRPITMLEEKLRNFNPYEKFIQIPVISNDELALVTQSFNQLTMLEWEFNQELIQKSEREVLLREIIEKIRSSLNINEILNFICDEVAKIFNVQRASIAEFPTSENYENYIIRREFKNIQEIKGIVNLKYLPQVAAYWAHHLLEKDEIIAVNNISESDTPE